MEKYFREPMNTLTHLVGALASLIALVFMILKTTLFSDFSLSKLIGGIIFGLSLILLYTASSVYHLVKASDKIIAILRKLDHSMIFVLIAGTYTPICIVTLPNTFKIIVLSIAWGLTLLGILMKVFWINCPRKLYTSFYIIMGWMSVFLIVPIYKFASISGVLFLVLGGILYTIGGVIYALKSPNISIKFGFHELFHVFVILGSLAHFFFIYTFLL